MRLLLAEDELSLSRALTAILKKNNYEVDAVYDGVEALAYLASGNYDGAILDIMMPGMDGTSVLRQARAEGNSTPVMMLSAISGVDDKVCALDCGANDYLTKPFAPQELLARIRAMTRRPQQGACTSRLQLGNITLDRSSFELSSPAGSFHLAKKEYQIMELLLTNPRQIISTDQIMDRIWGLNNDVEVSVVWVYISYLRKKLGALRASVQIRATRNVGYSIEELEAAT